MIYNSKSNKTGGNVIVAQKSGLTFEKCFLYMLILPSVLLIALIMVLPIINVFNLNLQNNDFLDCLRKVIFLEGYMSL